MKKTLLAAALFAGFAGAAQADTTVTLYGVLDGGIEYLNIKTPTGAAQASYNSLGMNSGVQSGSRWGLKGMEDLGGGTQAMFQLESGFSIGSGMSAQGGRLFGRRAFMGLQNPSWGSIRVGRGPTVSTDMIQGGASDPFAWGWGEFSLGNIATSLDTYRTDNQVGYMSPVFSGFQVGAGYSFNVDSTNANTAGIGQPMTKRTQGFDAAATYTNGPLFMGLTYSQTNPYAASGATTGNVRQLVVDASYDLQVVRIYGAYVAGWNGLVGSGTGGTMVGSGGVPAFSMPTTNMYYTGMKQNAFMVGVSAPVGTATSVFATYQHQTLGGAAAYLAGTAGTAMNTFGVGATYSLSKRTNLYTALGYTNGDGNVSGQKATDVIVGMRHQF